MQNYHDLQNTEAANVYLDKVKDNIQTVASNFSGTSFPTDNLQVGMLCYRTDKKKLYQLTDTDPITWDSGFLNKKAAINLLKTITLKELL